jgi:uncharacterized protein YpuA (DUF1002 family)
LQNKNIGGQSMINESVKQIVTHKAKLIRRSSEYLKYLDELFKELKISDIKETALLGAVDAMIYDVACSLDFTKQKGKINDWPSYSLRKSVLKELWK